MAADRLHSADNCWSPSAQAGSVVAGTAPLSVVVEQTDLNTVVVSVAGEIDLLSAPALQDHLSTLLAARPQRLVIDLSDVSFLGAAALSVLISARGVAAHQGTTLQLRAPHRQLPASTLTATGLDHLLEVVPPSTDTDDRDNRHPGNHAEVPRPRSAPPTDTAACSESQSSVEADEDEYGHLIPLHRRYAELTDDDPQRQRLRDQLVHGYRPVAEHLARRFAGRNEPLEDLVQVATIGLINAIDRFDPARGSHFLSFAVPTITGELRRYFRDHGWCTHVPRRLKDLSLAVRKATAELSHQLGRSPRSSEIADRLGVPTSTVIEALYAADAYRSSSLDDVLCSGETTTTSHMVLGELDPQMCLIDDRETLRPLLAQLAPRQRTILALRFFHQLTQTQIAEQVGISQMHVSRLLRQTLDFLHQQMTDSQQSPRRHRTADATKHADHPRKAKIRAVATIP
jgi:RNA polymerase sigma-B factor